MPGYMNIHLINRRLERIVRGQCVYRALGKLNPVWLSSGEKLAEPTCSLINFVSCNFIEERFSGCGGRVNRRRRPSRDENSILES